MEHYIYWFLLALVLLGLEMVTGTFYLLMVAVAMALAGATALLGAGMVSQLTVCAIAVIAGTILLRHWKSTQASPPSNVSFDVGQQVKVLRWNDDGSARVFYRGAEWDAELESAGTPREGALYIAAVRGSVLVLTPRKPQ